MKKGIHGILTGMSVLLMVSAAFGSAETLIFSDAFNNGFGNNWTAGTNTALNPGVAANVQDGRVVWTQPYDYIQTVESFEGPFRVEVDLERIQGSVRCKDFVVELVDTEALSGVLRLQYGGVTKDTVNLGQSPSLNSDNSEYQGVCVEDSTGYISEMATVSPHQGTAVLTYQNNKVKFAFTNYHGEKIETPWKNAGALGPRQVRIWATSGSRFVDAVRIYSLDEGIPDNDCASYNGSNADIEIPCLMIDGVKYKLQMQFDPGKTDGYYWKLDPDSLEVAE